MDDNDELALRFEAHRDRMWSVAYRVLGTPNEADDALQEAWLRLSRADADAIGNLGGWLTTVVGRVCLNMLRARRSRPEDAVDDLPEPAVDGDGYGPEAEVVLAGSIGPALFVVLETLAPAERVAFVLHDVFAVPFDEVAPIVERTPAATRQLASRARRRVQAAPATAQEHLPDQRQLVEAFLAAARQGDLDGLINLLHPAAVVRADARALAMGGTAGARGARAVAETFSGRARVAKLVLAGGMANLAWAPGGQAKVLFKFTVADGQVMAIDLIANVAHIQSLDVSVIPAGL